MFILQPPASPLYPRNINLSYLLLLGARLKKDGKFLSPFEGVMEETFIVCLEIFEYFFFLLFSCLIFIDQGLTMQPQTEGLKSNPFHYAFAVCLRCLGRNRLKSVVIKINKDCFTGRKKWLFLHKLPGEIK